MPKPKTITHAQRRKIASLVQEFLKEYRPIETGHTYATVTSEDMGLLDLLLDTLIETKWEGTHDRDARRPITAILLDRNVERPIVALSLNAMPNQPNAQTIGRAVSIIEAAAREIEIYLREQHSAEVKAAIYGQPLTCKPKAPKPDRKGRQP